VHNKKRIHEEIPKPGINPGGDDFYFTCPKIAPGTYFQVGIPNFGNKM